MNKLTVFLVGIIVLIVVGVVSGLLWNNTIANTFGIPEFSLLKSIGVVLLLRLVYWFMVQKTG